MAMPNLGLIPMRSLEEDTVSFVDTGSINIAKAYTGDIDSAVSYFEKSFAQVGAPTVSCELEEDHISKLLQFFKAKHR